MSNTFALVFLTFYLSLFTIVSHGVEVDNVLILVTNVGLTFGFGMYHVVYHMFKD